MPLGRKHSQHSRSNKTSQNVMGITLKMGITQQQLTKQPTFLQHAPHWQSSMEEPTLPHASLCADW